MYLSNLIKKTPLEYCRRLSKKYNCDLYFKREDLQVSRSFKIRGAGNAILKAYKVNNFTDYVCASAGNHAQGVAIASLFVGRKCDIFMPTTTPNQKVNQILSLDNSNNIKIHLKGNSVEESMKYAKDFSNDNSKIFIHPYDDSDVIEGQGTIAEEIYMDLKNTDTIIGCVGGGGLIAGITEYRDRINADTHIVGAESDTCPSLDMSLKYNRLYTCEIDDCFVDGATVATVGKIPYTKLTKAENFSTSVVKIGKLCETIVELYNKDGIICEPAGALAVASLDTIPSKHIVGKNVVCVISGGNNDINRYPEIVDRMLRYQNLKRYYVVEFIQKAGELRKFINNILGDTVDIIHFEYIKKTNINNGQVLIGIELENNNDYIVVEKRFVTNNIKYVNITSINLPNVNSIK